MKMIIMSLYFIGNKFSLISASVPSRSQGSWARNIYTGNKMHLDDFSYQCTTVVHSTEKYFVSTGHTVFFAPHIGWSLILATYKLSYWAKPIWELHHIGVLYQNMNLSNMTQLLWRFFFAETVIVISRMILMTFTLFQCQSSFFFGRNFYSFLCRIIHKYDWIILF